MLSTTFLVKFNHTILKVQPEVILYKQPKAMCDRPTIARLN